MRVIAVYREGALLYGRVGHARGFWARLRGLLGRSGLSVGEGLLLTPCGQVHTLGMRFSLDVVFLDRAGRVLKCVEGLRPNRFAAAAGARHVLEVAAGSVARCGIRVGDLLAWRESD